MEINNFLAVVMGELDLLARPFSTDSREQASVEGAINAARTIQGDGGADVPDHAPAVPRQGEVPC